MFDYIRIYAMSDSIDDLTFKFFFISISKYNNSSSEISEFFFYMLEIFLII